MKNWLRRNRQIRDCDGAMNEAGDYDGIDEFFFYKGRYASSSVFRWRNITGCDTKAPIGCPRNWGCRKKNGLAARPVTEVRSIWTTHFGTIFSHSSQSEVNTVYFDDDIFARKEFFNRIERVVPKNRDLNRAGLCSFGLRMGFAHKFDRVDVQKRLLGSITTMVVGSGVDGFILRRLIIDRGLIACVKSLSGGLNRIGSDESLIGGRNEVRGGVAIVRIASIGRYLLADRLKLAN